MMRANALRNKMSFKGKNSAFRTMKGKARIAKPPTKYLRPVRRTVEMPGS